MDDYDYYVLIRIDDYDDYVLIWIDDSDNYVLIRIDDYDNYILLRIDDYDEAVGSLLTLGGSVLKFFSNYLLSSPSASATSFGKVFNGCCLPAATVTGLFYRYSKKKGPKMILNFIT